MTVKNRFLAVLLLAMSGLSSVAMSQQAPSDKAAANNIDQSESFFSSPSFQLLDEGFAAYKSDGREAAMQRWLKDSSLKINEKQINEQLNNLGNVEKFYGSYSSYDYLKIVHLTTKTKIAYLIVNYENGPLFSRFVIYRNKDNNWVTTSFAFNTEVEYVVPDKFINNYLTPLPIN